MMHGLRRNFWSVYGRFVWAKRQPSWKQEQLTRIVSALEAQSQIANERVLDSGCGTGDQAAALADAGFIVVGTDYAPGMLFHAAKKITAKRKERLSFQQVNLEEKLPFDPEEFNHIINISVLQATAHPLSVLKELRRVLKVGGTLFLLHVPKPEAHTLPFQENFKQLVSNSQAFGTVGKALIATKLWAERTRGGRYWSIEEVRGMIIDAGFEVFEERAKPVIVLHARKPR